MSTKYDTCIKMQLVDAHTHTQMTVYNCMCCTICSVLGGNGLTTKKSTRFNYLFIQLNSELK